MTSQIQLVELAKRHDDDTNPVGQPQLYHPLAPLLWALALRGARDSNAAINALMLSLVEARGQVCQASLALRAGTDAIACALAGEEGFSIPLDSTHLVLSAAKLSAALTRMASDYFTLATTLEALGEDVSY